ncbi:hypothetical protein PAECIP111802_06816 [Paenibacillus allorhizosphaerae]|uniref:Glyoxalase/fosfomycin resistance/dioxygenase domain-containing protein n=1 Tax=Paenibacillus allorhizosphaerae TaxID=2849866 RepID=A0ABM8VTF3_9BACL|nr:hypothetical protein PAECIP111802_06816 [Paenibacillus allorhizosphaerae]
MKIKRIVANIETQDISKASYFYGEVLGLDQLMDMGFIATYGSHEKMSTQVSFLLEGGSGHLCLICQLRLMILMTR